jgi:hypothetical protein
LDVFIITRMVIAGHAVGFFAGLFLNNGKLLFVALDAEPLFPGWIGRTFRQMHRGIAFIVLALACQTPTILVGHTDGPIAMKFPFCTFIATVPEPGLFIITAVHYETPVPFDVFFLPLTVVVHVPHLGITRK